MVSEYDTGSHGYLCHQSLDSLDLYHQEDRSTLRAFSKKKNIGYQDTVAWQSRTKICLRTTSKPTGALYLLTKLGIGSTCIFLHVGVTLTSAFLSPSDPGFLLRRLQVPLIRSSSVPSTSDTLYAILWTSAMWPGGRIRRSQIGAFLRQEEKKKIPGRIRRPEGRSTPGANHSDYGQIPLHRE